MARSEQRGSMETLKSRLLEFLNKEGSGGKEAKVKREPGSSTSSGSSSS